LFRSKNQKSILFSSSFSFPFCDDLSCNNFLFLNFAGYLSLKKNYGKDTKVENKIAWEKGNLNYLLSVKKMIKAFHKRRKIYKRNT